MAKASWRETRLAQPTVRQARWETGRGTRDCNELQIDGQLVVNPSQTATLCLGMAPRQQVLRQLQLGPSCK